MIKSFAYTAESELERSRWLYAPIEPFLAMKVMAITSKREPIFHATVVGKPPLEGKYMGWATERIFLSLLRTSVPKPLGYGPTQISQIYEKAPAHLLPLHASQAQPPLRARSQFA